MYSHSIYLTQTEQTEQTKQNKHKKMDLTYNSISGMNVDPTVYLKEIITKNGKQDSQLNADTKVYLLIALGVIIVMYGLFFAILGGGSGQGQGVTGSASSVGLKFFEVLLWSVFIMLVILNGFQYFFNVNLTTRFIDFFTEKPKKKCLIYPITRTRTMTQKRCVQHTAPNLRAMTKLKTHTKTAESGATTAGPINKWRYFQPKKKHGTNFKKSRDTNTTAVDRELMGDSSTIKMFNLV